MRLHLTDQGQYDPNPFTPDKLNINCSGMKPEWRNVDQPNLDPVTRLTRDHCGQIGAITCNLSARRRRRG